MGAELGEIDYRRKFSLEGKLIIIIGGCGLIGRAFYEACAQHGANVAISDVKITNIAAFYAELEARHSTEMLDIVVDVGKRDSSRYWNGLMVFWAFPKQNLTLNRRKLIKNWQTGMRNSFLEKGPHNSK